MADTDIYKKREPMPMGSDQKQKKPRRRRRASRQAFDDRPRERRSKNNGLRRLLHLTRKKENEKLFWTSLIVTLIVVLAVIGIWQFVIFEHMVREEERQDDYNELHQERIPKADDQSSRGTE